MKKILLLLLLAIFSVNLNAQISLTATAGTTTGTYSTLKASFDAVNAGTHQGIIVITVTANTTETVSAVLNASGSGSASYTSINIYPTTTGLSISGNLAAPLIDLNGADNITIDGRVNATGSTVDLTITNTSNSSTAGTSTVRFINDATYNTVNYCTIKGSETNNAYGIIYFGTSTSGSGNDNNTISNNDITNAGTRPVNAVYSLGTTGQDNSGITISNNNFYDFLSTNTGGSAINVVGGNTDWTISGNSFYNVGSWNPSNTSYWIISINNTSGNNFTISGNYLGGSAAFCGGSPFTKLGSGRDNIGGILMAVGISSPSSIQGNTIQNFNITNNSNTRNFTGIEVDAGNVNIGTTSGNTIGANTGTGSITCYNCPSMWGIIAGGSGIIDIANNNIGSVTLNTASASAANIQCISSSVSGTLIIRNNMLGSTSTANSVNSISASTAASQSVYGIYNTGTGIISIYNNTISNLANNGSGAGSLIAGVYNGSGAATSTVKSNFIRTLTLTNASSSADDLYGISIAGGTTTYANNIINIGDNAATTIYGIYETGAASNNNNLYFNTVYIEGSPTTGSINSYALYSAVTTNTRNFRNNIFYNARTNNGATGKHYAAYFNYAVSTNLTLDYNDYYAPGTGGVLGYYNSADVTSLPLIATMDANSLNIDPLFNNAGGTLSTDYFLSASLPGVAGTGITTDYSGIVRSVTTPRMGAWDVNYLLPISLASFNGIAIGDVNQLSWVTVNEINNNYFELQRSVDGISFSLLGIIKSKGNSNTSQSYNYTDEMPLSGNNYYRLKQVDIDGSFTYSSIIMIANNSTGNRVIVYPNPTSGQIIISITKSLTNASIRLYDINGRMIMQQSNVSGNSFTLNITDQPAGIYFIEVNESSVKERFKILKQ